MAEVQRKVGGRSPPTLRQRGTPDAVQNGPDLTINIPDSRPKTCISYSPARGVAGIVGSPPRRGEHGVQALTHERHTRASASDRGPCSPIRLAPINKTPINKPFQKSHLSTDNPPADRQIRLSANPIYWTDFLTVAPGAARCPRRPFCSLERGPPRAPSAREAAVAPTAGGCRPPNPPLRNIFLIFDLFPGGART